MFIEININGLKAYGLSWYASSEEYMSLRKKTLFILSLIFVCLAVFLYSFSKTILLKGFADIERQISNQSLHQLMNILSLNISSLNSQIKNWAAWDETYDFIENPDNGFAE